MSNAHPMVRAGAPSPASPWTPASGSTAAPLRIAAGTTVCDRFINRRGDPQVIGEPGPAIGLFYPDIYPPPAPADLVCLPEGAQGAAALAGGRRCRQLSHLPRNRRQATEDPGRRCPGFASSGRRSTPGDLEVRRDRRRRRRQRKRGLDLHRGPRFAAVTATDQGRGRRQRFPARHRCLGAPTRRRRRAGDRAL